VRISDEPVLCTPARRRASPAHPPATSRASPSLATASAGTPSRSRSQRTRATACARRRVGLLLLRLRPNSQRPLLRLRRDDRRPLPVSASPNGSGPCSAYGVGILGEQGRIHGRRRALRQRGRRGSIWTSSGRGGGAGPPPREGARRWDGWARVDAVSPPSPPERP
jgi:hypothetical protein